VDAQAASDLKQIDVRELFVLLSFSSYPEPHDLDPKAEIRSLNQGVPPNQDLPLVTHVSIFAYLTENAMNFANSYLMIRKSESIDSFCVGFII
jgi:hypothetical protein